MVGRRRAIVRENAQVLEQGYVDAKGLLRKPLLGKTIVFAVNKSHAETLAQLFDAQFAHLKPSAEARFVDYVVSGQGADEPPRILRSLILGNKVCRALGREAPALVMFERPCRDRSNSCAQFEPK